MSVIDDDGIVVTTIIIIIIVIIVIVVAQVLFCDTFFFRFFNMVHGLEDGILYVEQLILHIHSAYILKIIFKLFTIPENLYQLVEKCTHDADMLQPTNSVVGTEQFERKRFLRNATLNVDEQIGYAVAVAG